MGPKPSYVAHTPVPNPKNNLKKKILHPCYANWVFTAYATMAIHSIKRDLAALSAPNREKNRDMTLER